MAGGRGTRMASPGTEKLLLPFPSRQGSPTAQTKPVVAHVVDTLLGCGCLDGVIVATSRNSPRTRQTLLSMYGSTEPRVRITDTCGDGYSADLGSVLAGIASEASGALIVSGDMPLLDHQIVREASSMYEEHAWVSIVISRECLEGLKMSLEYQVMVGRRPCYYTGVSAVDVRAVGSDSVRHVCAVLDDQRIAFTLNTRRDYDEFVSRLS